jgi:nucleotide-binding universal stress UspA family protein
MEKRILVALDGTEIGEAVIPKLEELVLGSIPNGESEITLVNVVPIVNYNVLTHDERAQLPYTESDRKELTQESEAYLEKVAAKLRIKGFNVKTMVRMGQAAEEIVKAAHETDANLIAMATSGRSGIIRWAIGSVSDKVIRLEGKIPVLAVHAKQKEEESSVLPLGSLRSLMKHS